MNLKNRVKEILNTIELRTFHLIVTGVSLVLFITVTLLLLNFFFNEYSQQLALAASQSIINSGLSEDVYLAIREADHIISSNLSLRITAVLAFSMAIFYIFYNVFFIRFILNPLGNINDKASEMIADRTKLGEQIPNPMFKEMQNVTSTFNKMSRELKSQMQFLEEKVQQRTEELNKAKENIEHLANHDALTGLPNRRLFNEHFSQAIRRSNRRKIKFSLLMIDLNEFKKINDTYGHMLGDQVIAQVAKRFRQGLRESDLICRWGGDEFAILALEIKNKSDIVKIITRILNAFDLPIQVSGRTFDIQMSIGVATYPNDGENQQTLIRNADDALYLAKRRHSPRSFRFYEESYELMEQSTS